MIVIIPMPLEPEELASLKATLLAQYNLTLEELLRNTIGAWELMAGRDSPGMDDLFVVGAVGKEDFTEWFEASKRLTDISHRIGNQIFQLLDPSLQATFDGDEVSVRMVKCVTNGIMLDLRKVNEDSANP